MIVSLVALVSLTFGVVLAAGEDFGLTQLGAAGVAVAICLYVMRMLWADNRDLRKDLADLTTKSLEKVVTVATEAATQMKEDAKVLQAAQQAIDRLASRPELTQEDIFELRAAIRTLKEAQ